MQIKELEDPAKRKNIARLGKLILAFPLVSACSAGRKPPQAVPAELEADLTAFYEEFLARDVLFAGRRLMAARLAVASLREQAPSVNSAAYQLALARIAAKANNAHTTLLNTGWAWQFNRIPVRLLLCSDGCHVAAVDDPAQYDLIGARLLGIDGHDWSSLATKWREFQSGREGWREEFIYAFAESPEVLHAAGLAESPAAVTLDLQARDGRTFRRRVAGSDDRPPHIAADIERLIPAPRELSLALWPYETLDTLPLYLQEPELPFRLKWLDKDTAYLQFRANFDPTGERDALLFCQGVMGQFRTRQPKNLLLDQRHNWGGDLTTTRELMQALPELVQSQVAILISGRTFSAGIASAAYALQALGERAFLVGSPVGDNLSFHAEGDLATLPHSNANLLYATERHDYRTGCPEADCHAAIRDHPIRISSLEPDIRVRPTFSDWHSGQDPLLITALDRLAAN